MFEAADGVEGVDAALRERPDLVVLDIGLPRLSGIEALRQIRAEQDVPVILLTARTSEAERVLGLELGADDYVGKPFSLREVAARIKSVLRRYGRYGHNAVRAHDVVRVASLEIVPGVPRFGSRRRNSASSTHSPANRAGRSRAPHCWIGSPSRAACTTGRWTATSPTSGGRSSGIRAIPATS